MRKFGWLLMMGILSGCVSQAQLQANATQRQALAERVAKAARDSTFICADEKECNKAWSLTKIYIQDNTDMKIQLSDDTVVSTYNPIKFGYVGLRATKTPDRGDSAVIKIDVVCKGYEGGSGMFFNECANRMAGIYEGYSKFMQGKFGQTPDRVSGNEEYQQDDFFKVKAKPIQ